jgi:hypothetical protein
MSQIDEIGIVEQRPAAQDHDNASVAERQLGKFAQQYRGRTFDDDIGMFPEPSERRDWNRARKTSQSRLRAHHIPRRHDSKGEAVDPLIEALSNHFADGAKAADCDTNLLAFGHVTHPLGRLLG